MFNIRSNPNINKGLIWVAVVYVGMLGSLMLFSLAGFSFRPPNIMRFLNVYSILLVVPTLIALYSNLGKKWANISFTVLPILLLFSPVPIELVFKIVSIWAIVPAFLLRGLKRWQKWSVGLPVGVIASFFLLTSPMWIFYFPIVWGRPYYVYSSMSPDRKHQIEVSHRDLGPFGDTTVNLYHTYPGLKLVRRFERNLMLSPDFLTGSDVEWIDSENVKIQGKRFHIGR